MTAPFLAPRSVRAEILGGDPLGHGDRPALSWWLPEGAARQTAYRVVTADGYDTGRVESDVQSYVDVPVFDRSRRRVEVRVQVWTDLGESAWSEPVVFDSGLLDESDWTASWIGVDEGERAPKGSRPAYWVRGVVEATSTLQAQAHVTALGMYELYVNGSRVGDVELAPGYTQYRDRVQVQTYDLAGLLRPGRNVVAVLLADGWFRGQVGTPRAADQFGTDLAVRVQVEASDGGVVAVLGASDATWRTSASHVVAADLIGGQRDDRRLVDPRLHATTSTTVPGRRHGCATSTSRSCARSRLRCAGPRRSEPVSVTRVGDAATIVDLGQNINGWVRLSDLGPEGTRARAAPRRAPRRRPATSRRRTSTSNLPIIPEPLPLGQVDEVVSAGVRGDVFEPRFTTHGFRYVRIEGHPGPLDPDDVTGVVVHTDLRRTGWFECSDERVNRLHEAVVWSLRGNVVRRSRPTARSASAPAGPATGRSSRRPRRTSTTSLGFTRKWLRDVALDQRADGCVANMSPLRARRRGSAGRSAFLNGSAGWGDVVVSAPWDLYEAYGDRRCCARPGSRRAHGSTSRRGRRRAAVTRTARPRDRHRLPTRSSSGTRASTGASGSSRDAEVDDFPAFVAADKAEVATAYLHRSARPRWRASASCSASTRRPLDRYRGHRRRRPGRLAGGVRRDPTARWRCRPRRRTCARSRSGSCPTTCGRGRRRGSSSSSREAGDHLGDRVPVDRPAAADARRQPATSTRRTQLLLQDTEPSWLTMIDRGATTVWERWNGVDADGVAARLAQPLQQGRGRLVPAPARRRAAADLAGLPHVPASGRVPGGGLTWATALAREPVRRDRGGVAASTARPSTSTSPCRAARRAEVVLPDGSAHAAGPGTWSWSCAR